MTPERWSRIEDLFLQVVDLPPSERQKFLDQVCANDDSLRRELNSLLASDVPDTPLIAVPVLSDDADLETGRRIGPYRLGRLLGRGGMGAVYLAARDDDQFRQQVAIKLLKRGMDTTFMLDRFRQERQILANLDHPFIARLLDGGATDDGLPYFVMEYVDGLPITSYCAARNLALNERLTVFRLVCEAVQYAHQNLVVHRDLKPGNILVAREGIPKLLDFGIAKLIHPDRLAGLQTATQADRRMMTPDYASPEQAKGLPVSTASDVYALGAVLYELLTGRHPYQFASASSFEIQRTICEVEPERPSVAVTRNEDIEPRTRQQQSRRLAGDLDNIILTALKKEPQRRYASAAEFSEDIRRHMDGLPVSAREDNAAYRVGKFIRRNRLAVSAAALLAATLIGGIVATTFQARRAERRFALVRQLAKSVLFDLHDQMQRLPGSTALRAATVQTVAHYLDSLSQDARRDPDLELEIADAYLRVAEVEGHPYHENLGKTASALTHFQKALEIYERHTSRESTRIRALTSTIVVNIEAGDIEARTGNPDAAAARLRKVAAIAADFEVRDRSALPPNTWVYVYFRLGDEESRRGAPHLALAYARKALEAARTFALIDHTANARSSLRGAYGKLAGALMENGDLSGARDNYQIALKTVAEVVRRPDATTYERSTLASAHQSLANVLGNPNELNLGDRAGAISHYREAIRISEESSADRHDVRARSDRAGLYLVTAALLLEENAAEALQFSRKALALSEEARLANPSNLDYQADVAEALVSEGEALRQLGQHSQALAPLARALELLKPLLPSARNEMSFTRIVNRANADIGRVLLARGDAAGALRQLQGVLESTGDLLRRSPSSLYLARDRADAWESLGQYYAAMSLRPGISAARRLEMKSEARAWFEKSLALWRDWIARKVAEPYASYRAKRVTNSIAYTYRK